MNHFLKFVFRYHRYLLLGALVAGVPVILNYSLFSWHAHGVNGDWIGFMGNYIGAIIGGFTAYFVARYQVDIQKKQEMQNQILGIKPYLRITNDESNKDDDKDHYFFITRQQTKNSSIGLCFIRIENIGLGTAIDIKFTELTGYEPNVELWQTSLLVSEDRQSVITIHDDFTKRQGTKMLTVTYSDLLGNNYRQFAFMEVMNVGRDGEAHIKIVNSTSPELFIEE